MTFAAITQHSYSRSPWRAPPLILQIGALILVLFCFTLTGCSLLPASHLPDNTPRAQVVKTAYQMLGTPYRYGGTSPGGFDCSGLVLFSYQQAGFDVPRTAFDQYLHSTPVPSNHLQPGDLLFFTLRSHSISHVGIYVGDGKFIHAPAFGRCVMESGLDEPYWQTHLVRAGRLF